MESLARRLEFASQQDQKEEEQPEASRAAAEEGVPPPTAVALSGSEGPPTKAGNRAPGWGSSGGA